MAMPSGTPTTMAATTETKTSTICSSVRTRRSCRSQGDMSNQCSGRALMQAGQKLGRLAALLPLEIVRRGNHFQLALMQQADAGAKAKRLLNVVGDEDGGYAGSFPDAQGL